MTLPPGETLRVAEPAPQPRLTVVGPAPARLRHNTIVEVTDSGNAINPSYLVWDGHLYHIGSGADYWDCFDQVGGTVEKLTQSQIDLPIDHRSGIDRCR